MREGFFIISLFFWAFMAMISCDENDNSNNDGDKDTANGNLIEPSFICNSTVCSDPDTGLTWQNPPEKNEMNWWEATDYCDNSVLDGYDDWRVPTINELRSLIRGCPDIETIGGESGVTDNCTFGKCDIIYGCDEMKGPARGCYWEPSMNGECSRYWSSMSIEDSQDEAWNVHFRSGFISFSLQNKLLYVRCVRNNDNADGDMDSDSDIVESDESIDDEYAIWTDPATGLVWQNPALKIIRFDTAMNWHDAMNYCDNLVLDDHDDWRLPTIDELRTLVRDCSELETTGECNVRDACLSDSCWNSACWYCFADCFRFTCPENECCTIIDLCIEDLCRWDSSLKGACHWYWSSSAMDDDDQLAWGIYFNFGALFDYHKNAVTNHIRCVRGGR